MKRIVVKIGTQVLTDEQGVFDVKTLTNLIGQIVAVKARGIEVIVVTSGAVGLGRGIITLATNERIVEKQVFAAVGQVKLMSTYAQLFHEHSVVCAQVLATKEDFRDSIHYFNMRSCFENLLKQGVVPVVNENDVVATTELLFTDNDELAGLVASQLGADAVVILTSVEGFLTGSPADSKSELIPEVNFKNAASYQKYISPDKSAFGRGGMLTKFMIAKKLSQQGITVYFARGKRNDVLTDIVAGTSVGTKFIAQKKVSALKRRIAYSEGLAKGVVEVNKCTEDLLCSDTRILSLLPVGLVRVRGDFKKGDIIEILGSTGEKLGFGIAEYGSEKARMLVGVKKSRPLVHYNHMFVGS